jgi:CubicO group peptidase (beta-lactamase class C family)
MPAGALQVQGTVDDRFVAMREVLQRNLDSGADLGASVAVMLDGEMVVDLWGGWADHERTAAWQSDTITNVWSSTKTMMALCALVLADRGELDLFAPVARYWPEFAANGKADIEVRHLLSHTSGVSGWAQPVTVDDIYDWEKSTSMLAAQEPWWEPGTASGYHALNQGHLVGEVVRRITGLKLGEFFAREIAGPLGADFHIGLDPAEFHRIAPVVPPPPMEIDFSTVDLDGVMIKTFTGPAPDASVSWTSEWRQADIGAANGHGNARSVARIQSAITNDGVVDGIRLLSPETIELIFREQASGMDLVLGVESRFGIGYGLPTELLPVPADARVCYWGGWGGSLVINDLDHRMTIAYMMNRMESGLVGDTRGFDLVMAARAAVS